MTELFGLAGTVSAFDSALLALVTAAGALFLVTVAFSGYAILLRLGHQVRNKRWERLTERWQGPVLAALTDPDASDAVHEVVDEKYRLHFVQFILEYSRRVRGGERHTLRALALPYLDPIADRLSHRSSEVRTRAVQTLGTLGLPKYSQPVIEGLDDPSPLVSMVAARYLARQDFPEFASSVLAHLDRFEGWHRRFLASMLAAIGPEASAQLREGLADSGKETWIRSVLADALRMLLDPVSGDVAAEVLGATEDRELLAACLRLIAEVGRPEHTTIVRELCESEDVVIRAQALRALGSIGQERDLPLLMEAMDDESPWAALHAARGVREAGARNLLTELASSDDERAALAGQVLDEEVEP